MESLSKLIEISATYREISDKFIELNSELVFRSEKAEEQVRGLIEANKKLTDDLEESAVELIESFQLTKELNLFISILAHDLKNPFNVLLNLSDLLLENIKQKPINEIESYSKILNQSAHSANNLLNDILKWVQNRTGTDTINSIDMSLFETCEVALDTLKLMANEKKVKIINHLSNTIVQSDPEIIKAILRNLLSNAIKFTPQNGTIKITSEENDKEYFVTVADNGIGIESERLKNLFDISTIQSTTGTNNETGTGLGLIICKQFVDKLGGQLWVESELGNGSQFHFSLPNQLNQRNLVTELKDSDSLA